MSLENEIVYQTKSKLRNFSRQHIDDFQLEDLLISLDILPNDEAKITEIKEVVKQLIQTKMLQHGVVWTNPKDKYQTIVFNSLYHIPLGQAISDQITLPDSLDSPEFKDTYFLNHSRDADLTVPYLLLSYLPSDNRPEQFNLGLIYEIDNHLFTWLLPLNQIKVKTMTYSNQEKDAYQEMVGMINQTVKKINDESTDHRLHLFASKFNNSRISYSNISTIKIKRDVDEGMQQLIDVFKDNVAPKDLNLK